MLLKSIFPILLVFLVACSHEDDVNAKIFRDAMLAEQMQSVNMFQYDRGNEFYDDFKSELAATRGEDQLKKKTKLECILNKLEVINAACIYGLSYIDSIKSLCLIESGYSISKYKLCKDEKKSCRY